MKIRNMTDKTKEEEGDIDRRINMTIKKMGDIPRGGNLKAIGGIEEIIKLTLAQN